MIRVNSRVRLNMTRIRELTGAQVIALEQTAEALHAEIVQSQVVPFQTGNLQNESMFVDDSHAKFGKVTLVHSTPYARRMYFHPEFNFSKEENPGAKGKWFEDWKPGGELQDFAPEKYKEIYRRLASV